MPPFDNHQAPLMPFTETRSESPWCIEGSPGTRRIPWSVCPYPCLLLTLFYCAFRRSRNAYTQRRPRQHVSCNRLSPSLCRQLVGCKGWLSPAKPLGGPVGGYTVAAIPSCSPAQPGATKSTSRGMVIVSGYLVHRFVECNGMDLYILYYCSISLLLGVRLIH